MRIGAGERKVAWIPACAGMTERGTGMIETDEVMKERDGGTTRDVWMPACAGMTQSRVVSCYWLWI
jgi:hypothetical protein